MPVSNVTGIIERRVCVVNEKKKGDLLKTECEAIVNTVNCVGVMGKGIALQFKKHTRITSPPMKRPAK